MAELYSSTEMEPLTQVQAALSFSKYIQRTILVEAYQGLRQYLK